MAREKKTRTSFLETRVYAGLGEMQEKDIVDESEPEVYSKLRAKEKTAMRNSRI